MLAGVGPSAARGRDTEMLEEILRETDETQRHEQAMADLAKAAGGYAIAHYDPAAKDNPYLLGFLHGDEPDILRALTRLLGKRRSWMLIAQLVIALGLFGMAYTDPTQALTQLVKYFYP